MSSIVIFLPLLSFFCCIQFGWLIGRRGSANLAISIMVLTLCFVIILFFKASYYQKLYFLTFSTWIYSDSLLIDWSLYYDNLTLCLLTTVIFVSTLVHLYSMDYMLHDPHLPRFMAYLSLFTFFMLLLISGSNFIILFLGWEGVGLCSYLLISFWYTRLQANKSAIKALIVNRIADLALTIALIAIFFVFRTFDFQTIFSLAPFITTSNFYFLGYEIPILTLICFLLFIGAMGKSAQIGLHTWLPDAMEGPTPVSALIHAATMVTAGVFLIIKCSALFEYVPSILTFITFVGGTTAFFSATVGLFQNDIKKVIAYSTCSQLGYMIFACGLSNYHVGLFHLINHAFFKALLFLSAGAIIHSLTNEQDIRKFGSLVSLLPFTFTMFLIGTLALIGLPFLTGFYSKDLILELALTKYSIEGSFVYSLGILTAFLSAFYSFRILYATFLYQNNSFRPVINHIHELPLKMAVAIALLSLGSIFFGYCAKDLLVGLGTDFWNESIFILPINNNQLEAEFFGLLNSLHFVSIKDVYYYNSTHALGILKLLPFVLCIAAANLVDELFLTTKRYHFDSFINLMAPYFMNMCLFHPWLIFPPLIHYIPNTTLYKAVTFNEILKKKDAKIVEIKRKMLYIKTDIDVDNSFFVFKQTLGVLPHYYNAFLIKLKNIFIVKKDALGASEKWKFLLRLSYRFFLLKWYFDLIYNEIINRILLKFAYLHIFTLQDKGLFEIFGPLGLSLVSFQFAFELKKTQLGRVYYYSYFMIMCLFISILSLNSLY